MSTVKSKSLKSVNQMEKGIAMNEVKRNETDMDMKHNTVTHKLAFWCERLAAQGVAKVTLEFSGGGDEGGCDVITLTNETGDEVTYTDGWKADNPVVRDLNEIPHWLYGSFAGEFSVSGTFTIDVVTATIRGEGQETVEESREWCLEDFESAVAYQEEIAFVEAQFLKQERDRESKNRVAGGEK